MSRLYLTYLFANGLPLEDDKASDIPKCETLQPVASSPSNAVSSGTSTPTAQHASSDEYWASSALLNESQDYTTLVKAFAGVKCDARYVCRVASPDKLKDCIYKACALRVAEPDSVSVLHLTCHADSASLHLECGTANMDTTYMKKEELEYLLTNEYNRVASDPNVCFNEKDHRPPFDLVLLMCCNGVVHAKPFTLRNMPVITTGKCAIDDTVGVNFAQALYQKLFVWDERAPSLIEAYEHACKSVRGKKGTVADCANSAPMMPNTFLFIEPLSSCEYGKCHRTGPNLGNTMPSQRLKSHRPSQSVALNPPFMPVASSERLLGRDRELRLLC